jgi:glutathione S-transferase
MRVTKEESYVPLRLYQADLSPYATRVRILAAAKGLKLECVPPSGGSLKSDAYLAINPLGRIPCLDHDGTIIPESETICEYLEDRFPSPTLRPVDAAARARVRLLSRMGDIYISPLFRQLIEQFNPKTRNEERVTAACNDLEAVLGTMTNFVEGPDYAIGERLSLADCTLIPLFFFIDAFLEQTYQRPSPLKGSMKLFYDNAQRDPHIAKGIGEMKAALVERTSQQAQ